MSGAEWVLLPWRVIWFIPFTVGRLLVTVSLFCGWGVEMAKTGWEALD